MSTHPDKDQLPLVYSCSGCSSAAQLANHVALQLDRRGVAEMSCIAGVGGDVPSLLKIAHSGRPIVALDGCPLVCVKSCLSRHGVEADRHYQLNRYGVTKRYHADFDQGEADAVMSHVMADLKASGPNRAGDGKNQSANQAVPQPVSWLQPAGPASLCP
ncbi:MAG: putative zinc-binding protein [Rhodoferax sp.]|nr:putative zinc-binding protein [Rhodoferax sp.]